MARTVTDVALMLNVIAFPDSADPLNVQTWNAEKKQHQLATPKIDFTQYLDANALKGAKIGVVRDFFGGDPEIDALAEKAIKKMQSLGATIVEVKLDPEFLESYLTTGGRTIRKLSDYRFKSDWEAYLATLGPQIPKTVADFVHLYETEVNKSPLPVEDSVMLLLKDSLTTSADSPAYKDLIDKVLPAATRAKLLIFDKFDVDALVFPYQSTFGPPISNPAYKIDDPTYVKSERPQPSILSGYSSVGFPGIVVPMGFGTQGLPMDISFFGKPYSEGKLISYAYAYEQASKLRKPSPLLPPLKGETVGYSATKEQTMVFSTNW
jgi:amidase